MQLNFKKLGSGQPLIVVHGLFGSLDNWMSFAKTMAENYEVFLVDARNHGQSPHSSVFNYDAMANDLVDFVTTQLVYENKALPIVLGHSMGGKIAMQFAIDYPHLLSKLIVADIAPKAYPIHHHEIIEALQSINFDEIKSRSAADEKLAEKIADISVRQFLLKNLYWKEKEQLAFRFNLEVISNNIEEVGKALITNNQTFSKPTLFVRGEKSNYILDSDKPEIEKVFTNSTLSTVTNSGHWIHAEQPNQFLEIVCTFLNKH